MVCKGVFVTRTFFHDEISVCAVKVDMQLLAQFVMGNLDTIELGRELIKSENSSGVVQMKNKMKTGL